MAIAQARGGATGDGGLSETVVIIDVDWDGA